MVVQILVELWNKLLMLILAMAVQICSESRQGLLSVSFKGIIAANIGSWTKIIVKYV